MTPRTLTIGEREYRLQAESRDGQWIAFAARTDTGERFGIECAAASETQALDRISAWLEWQSEHQAALAALQQAERAYHRTVSATAFAGAADGSVTAALQSDSLDDVEEARRRLDEIRARRPEY
jgi:hypothetical protein